MKRRRVGIQLTEEQHLTIALLLVILLAISMLYCLGFSSLALRHAWETKALPWSTTIPPAEEIDMTPIPPLVEPATATPLP